MGWSLRFSSELDVFKKRIQDPGLAGFVLRSPMQEMPA